MNKFTEVFVKFGEKMAQVAANTACYGRGHQPTPPPEAQKLRKF